MDGQGRPGSMTKTVMLHRHTDNDGDALSDAGIHAALTGGAQLVGGYALAVSSGAQRATQTIGCFLAALGERCPGGVVVEPRLRSDVEDRWKAAFKSAGSPRIDDLQQADPELVSDDGAALAEGLRAVFDRLDDGERALVVGHSPTNEAAVHGLTGQVAAPLGKGAGVEIRADGSGYRLV